jgi:RHS repeat-associated protein
VQEKLAGLVKNTTILSYDETGAPLSLGHDQQHAAYQYDTRNLLATVVNGTSATDPDPKVTSYSYTDRGQRLREVKGNGNTVDHSYLLDGMLSTQAERKPDSTLVSEHSIGYDLNGNRTRDAATKMNADDPAAYLNTTTDYTYDPRDRIAQASRTGHGPGTETYLHDGNNNVISQTVAGTTTSYSYDRNRLLSSTTSGTTAGYNYDPFGRLDTITSGGQITERNIYDGFDHLLEHRKTTDGTTTTTGYTFDPLDRTTSKTTDAGTAAEKTTTFSYLGLSSEVLDEQVAGQISKSYQYSPWGQRLSQVSHNTDGTDEDAFYGYNPHTDVETLTDQTGDPKATYGYTAYGSNDHAQFTGIDKPDPQNPTKQPYNLYRYNAKRWDPVSGSYDMGFRDYHPGLNRFLTRDTYNGALADLNLSLNPWTGNRYAFAGGNPITGIEHDGHCPIDACGAGTPIGGGRIAQTGPIDPGNPAAGYLRDGVWAPPAAPASAQVNFFHTPVTAPDWDTYTDAYLATMQQWTADGYRPPQPECMSPDTQCLGADNLDVTFFAEKLCQQPGITCPAHPNPLQQALGAAAAAGMLVGGRDGSGAPVGRPMRLPTSQTWGRPSTLEDHFLRHGSDFGVRTPDEYAAMASEFFQRSQFGGGYLTKVDSEGVIRVYDPRTNSFGAFNPNGTTRTFFKPNRGIDYWHDQLGAPPVELGR